MIIVLFHGIIGALGLLPVWLYLGALLWSIAVFPFTSSQEKKVNGKSRHFLVEYMTRFVLPYVRKQTLKANNSLHPLVLQWQFVAVRATFVYCKSAPVHYLQQWALQFVDPTQRLYLLCMDITFLNLYPNHAWITSFSHLMSRNLKQRPGAFLCLI